tara:strand:+ start:9851 stop:10468 length:618 start_codon:yes stop_codon:yes gene_type:complete
MTWETILKIKNNQGENLKVKDVATFTRRLRDELNHVGSEHYGKISQALNEDDPRKSNVVVKETWVSDEILKIVASVRHKQTQVREYYEIILKEDDEGDFYYLSAYGPSVSLGRDDVVSSEIRLVLMIGEAVERVIEDTVRQQRDLRDTTGENRKTGKKTIQEVEDANPGYLFINQKMHKITDLKEKADKEGISYEQLLRRMGRDI